ncbi:MAG: hypothetical protein U0X20_12520 [Caldilineaceae bacterium]
MGTVRLMHMEFVEPSKRYADIIVRAGDNRVAMEMIVSRVQALPREHAIEVLTHIAFVHQGAGLAVCGTVGSTPPAGAGGGGMAALFYNRHSGHLAAGPRTAAAETKPVTLPLGQLCWRRSAPGRRSGRW